MEIKQILPEYLKNNFYNISYSCIFPAICYNLRNKGECYGRYKNTVAFGILAAMNLEFSENRSDLIFEPEYNLNTKPLEIDLLIIKKQADVSLTNEIGSFFRGHNIMEYKSPEDHLDIDVFYKSMAYAALYKAYGRTLDEIKADDITVTLIRETKPEGLFRYLKEHIWLNSLSARLQKQDMKDLFDRINQLENTFDRDLADSILEVSINANKEVVENWKGDDTMCQALMEI